MGLRWASSEASVKRVSEHLKAFVWTLVGQSKEGLLAGVMHTIIRQWLWWMLDRGMRCMQFLTPLTLPQV